MCGRDWPERQATSIWIACRIRSEDLGPVAQYQQRLSLSARHSAAIEFPRNRAIYAVRHFAREKANKISDENKSVPHFCFGLTLARMNHASAHVKPASSWPGLSRPPMLHARDRVHGMPAQGRPRRQSGYGEEAPQFPKVRMGTFTFARARLAEAQASRGRAAIPLKTTPPYVVEQAPMPTIHRNRLLTTAVAIRKVSSHA